MLLKIAEFYKYVNARFSFGLAVGLGGIVGALLPIRDHPADLLPNNDHRVRNQDVNRDSRKGIKDPERINAEKRENKPHLLVPFQFIRDVKTPFLIWNNDWEINPVWAGIVSEDPAKLDELRNIFRRSFAALRQVEKSLCKVSRSDQGVSTLLIPAFESQGDLIRSRFISDLHAALPPAVAQFIYKLTLAQSFDNGFNFGALPTTVIVGTSVEGGSLISCEVGPKRKHYHLNREALPPQFLEIVNFIAEHETEDR